MGNHHSHDRPARPPEFATEINDIKLCTLQHEVGDSPVFKISNFENWGKTQTPRKVFKATPTTVEEVQKVVKAAAKLKLKVNSSK